MGRQASVAGAPSGSRAGYHPAPQLMQVVQPRKTKWYWALEARSSPRRGASAFRQQALHQERDLAFGLRVELAAGAAGETGVHTAHLAVAAQEESGGSIG